MNVYQNPKVVGAFLVGSAMVLGAYVFSTFGQVRNTANAPLNLAAVEAPARVFVPVSDVNADGIEDWRDQFVSAPAVNISKANTADYKPPTTLTDQLGISLMEGLIASKGAAPISKTEENVVSDTVTKLGKIATSDYVYGVRDINISSDISDEAIRNYGNSLANVLLTESVPGLENEILLLRDFLTDPTKNSPDDLITLTQVYKNYRDKTLSIPVPKTFVKEHLDLVNVYNAMYLNIDAMTKAASDPMMPFIRIKRYEDDVKGLALAYSNIYNALVPYARVFEMNDPAILFTNFYQSKP